MAFSICSWCNQGLQVADCHLPIANCHLTNLQIWNNVRPAFELVEIVAVCFQVRMSLPTLVFSPHVGSLSIWNLGFQVIRQTFWQNPKSLLEISLPHFELWFHARNVHKIHIWHWKSCISWSRHQKYCLWLYVVMTPPLPLVSDSCPLRVAGGWMVGYLPARLPTMRSR